MRTFSAGIGDSIAQVAVILSVLALGATDAVAQPLVGIASVIDGDTIEIHGTRIRLNGIDAPESAQPCLDGAGRKYRCGQRSSLALADFLASRQPASCVEVGRDQFRRVVAVAQPAASIWLNGWSGGATRSTGRNTATATTPGRKIVLVQRSPVCGPDPSISLGSGARR